MSLGNKQRAVAALALGMALQAAAALAAEPFAYPPAGRTPEQQRQDQFECHQWAVEQTHFDPVQQASQTATPPTAPQGQQAQRAPGGGAVGGAVKGAVVAEAADEDAGDGARAGAVVGLLRARRAQGAAAAEAQQTAQRQQAQQAKELETKRGAYLSARSTCYRGRGYTVSE